MNLSIIIPTISRRTLIRTLLSIYPEILPSDEVLVVGDGTQPWAQEAVPQFGTPFRYIEGPRTCQWGHAQRTLGMSQAKGDYLAFMDDDDVYLPGGIDSIRRGVRETAAGMLLFRMRHHDRVIWEKPEIRHQNLSTQMAVIKNEPTKLGNWTSNPRYPDGRGGDFYFIEQTAALWPPSSIIFRDEVIAELTNHGSGR